MNEIRFAKEYNNWVSRGEHMYKLSGITVEELLKLDVMKDASVLAGKDGLKSKITKVNVMEVPDIVNWVEEGEFLLTTAYSMKDNLNELSELIVQLKQKKLAGLGIKTKRYINNIPDSVKETANKLGFPLIEIPFEISYSTLIANVLTVIVNNQTNMLYRIDNMHNKLINVMLNNGGLKEIAKALYDSIDRNSMVIRDYMFETNVVMCDDCNKEYIEKIIEEDMANEGKNINGKNATSLNRRKIDTFGDKEVTRITIPIYTSDRNYGCVHIWEDKKPITPVELTIIEAATPIIALDLYKKISVFEIESKHKIEFFEDLLSDDESRHKKALDMASYFEFEPEFNYSAIIIAINDSKKYNKLDPNTSDYFHQVNMKMLSIIKRITKNRYKRTIYGSKSNKIIILFGTEKSEKVKKVKQDINLFCDEIVRYADYESVSDDIYIGIGRNYSQTNELWKSYREANRVIEYVIRFKSKKVVHYDELGIYRILSYEDLQPELKQFHTELLEPLVKYDKEKGTDFIVTLTNYFKYAGNLKKVSEEMYTHYNTVIYRIQRIKEITGIDLDNYDDRLNLQISLKIHEMLENEKI